MCVYMYLCLCINFFVFARLKLVKLYFLALYKTDMIDV